MSISGIQGRILEVTVVSCTKLKDTEWISRQDPYVCIEYASTKYRTRTCKDGGKNPTFQEKFVFTLIEGLRELNAVVWNSNTVSHDDFIGNGKIQLHKVLSSGFDDCSWPLQTKTGRHAGEVRLIMHYADAKKPATSYTSSANYTPSAPPAVSQVPHYSSHAMGSSYPPAPAPHSSYPPAPAPHSSYPPAPAPHSSYPPAPAPHSSYPTPSSAGYPPPPYYPPQQSAYPPSPYAPYPPPAHDPHHYPPGSYPPPSSYPPPPY